MNTPLLSVENLSVTFNHQQTVVDNISFTINAGETFALVGESGSGKSITALSVLRLLPNNAQIKAHAINLQGDNLIKRAEFELCKIRGKRISLIFQDPMSSLNPVMTIGRQIEEALKVHFSLSRKDIKTRVLELLVSPLLKAPSCTTMTARLCGAATR